MKKSIVVLLMLFVTVISYPATYFMSQDIDLSDPSSIVAYLTPFIVLAATWLAKKVLPAIPGWAVLMIVTGLSALTAYVTGLIGNPEMSFEMQFALGLAATFLHQIKVQFSGDSSRK